MSLLPGLSSVSNLHPLFVHFPIALWPTALAALLFALVRKEDWAWRSGVFLHGLATTMAAITVFTGYRAAEQLGHSSAGHELVHVHRNFMVGALVISLIVGALSVFSEWRDERRLRPLIVLGLVVINGVAMLGADRGAEMVYVYGTGVRFEPAPVSRAHHAHGEHAH